VWDVGDWESPAPRHWRLTTNALGLGELAVTRAGDEIAATLEPKIGLFSDDPVPKARRSLTVWHFPGGKPRQFPINHPVFGIAFSPDGKLVAGALGQGFFDDDFDLLKRETGIAVWHVDQSRDAIMLHGHQREAVGVAFSPDGSRLASVSTDGTLRLWDVTKWKAAHTISFGPPQGHRGRHGETFAFSPSGRHFALCNSNGTIYILRLPKR